MPKSNKNKQKKSKNKSKTATNNSNAVNISLHVGEIDQDDSGSESETLLPFVSICTPTFNRRPFIPFMIKCFEHQTYPKDRIEWIIIDDGTDPIEDLVKDIRTQYEKDGTE